MGNEAFRSVGSRTSADRGAEPRRHGPPRSSAGRRRSRSVRGRRADGGVSDARIGLDERSDRRRFRAAAQSRSPTSARCSLSRGGPRRSSRLWRPADRKTAARRTPLDRPRERPGWATCAEAVAVHRGSVRARGAVLGATPRGTPWLRPREHRSARAGGADCACRSASRSQARGRERPVAVSLARRRPRAHLSPVRPVMPLLRDRAAGSAVASSARASGPVPAARDLPLPPKDRAGHLAPPPRKRALAQREATRIGRWRCTPDSV
jgi:hypothetical protein